VVRCRPVDPVTDRTREENLLGRKDIRWDDRLQGFFGRGLKDCIALKAARKQVVSQPQTAFTDHLTQLVSIMIAFNKYKRRRLLLFQPTVAGQDQPVLRPSRSDQSVTGQMRPIGHVLANDAKPLDEPAQHAIRRKFKILCCHTFPF